MSLSQVRTNNGKSETETEGRRLSKQNQAFSLRIEPGGLIGFDLPEGIREQGKKEK